MDDLIYWIIIFVISLIVGWKSYKYLVLYDAKNDSEFKHNKAPLSWKIHQAWNQSICFFIGGSVLYYFVKVRWEQISNGATVSLSDCILILFFLMSVTGLMPYFLTNITRGIEAILKKILG